MCGVGGAVFVVGGNVGIHHRLNGFLLGFAVLVEVIVIHIKGTVTIKAEAKPLGEHHSLSVFEFVIDLRAFLSIIRKCTDLKELTPELVNRLITKIEVFDSTKDENGKKHVPIKVHFIGVGVIVIPDGKTILETYEEIRKNPPRVA